MRSLLLLFIFGAVLAVSTETLVTRDAALNDTFTLNTAAAWVVLEDPLGAISTLEAKVGGSLVFRAFSAASAILPLAPDALDADVVFSATAGANATFQYGVFTQDAPSHTLGINTAVGGMLCKGAAAGYRFTAEETGTYSIQVKTYEETLNNLNVYSFENVSAPDCYNTTFATLTSSNGFFYYFYFLSGGEHVDILIVNTVQSGTIQYAINRCKGFTCSVTRDALVGVVAPSFCSGVPVIGGGGSMPSLIGFLFSD